MPADFQAILDQAERMTEEQMDSRISSLTRLTDSELSSLCPTKADKKKLAELMAIVKEATDENVKRQKIIDNISNFASIIIKIAGKTI